jgi:nitrogen fixation/metabolism regulation signal transduction histidine kinase
MNRITSRFVLLIATAAVAPLIIYGIISVNSLRNGTQASVRDGNLRVAQQVGEQVSLYVGNNKRVLRSIGAELSSTGLQDWQQRRILVDHVLDFPEFREISIFDVAGRVLSTSRLTKTSTLGPPPANAELRDGVYIAPFRIDDDLLPTTTLAVKLTSLSGETRWLVGELSLEELWRMVDRIRVGSQGYALIIDEDGRLIAHGDPDEKRRIASTEDDRPDIGREFAIEVRRSPTVLSKVYSEADGRQMLAVAAPMQNPQWTVLVEQPTTEAYATMRRLERQLLAAIGLALLGTVVVGYLWGRSFIRRIFALTHVTRSIAEGKLETRVALTGQDEIR